GQAYFRGLVTVIDDLGPSDSSSSRVVVNIAGPFTTPGLPSSCTRTGSQVSCALGAIANQGHAFVRIPLGQDIGPLKRMVTVTGAGTDRDSTNNAGFEPDFNPFGRPTPSPPNLSDPSLSARAARADPPAPAVLPPSGPPSALVPV